MSLPNRGLFRFKKELWYTVGVRIVREAIALTFRTMFWSSHPLPAWCTRKNLAHVREILFLIKIFLKKDIHTYALMFVVCCTRIINN